MPNTCICRCHTLGYHYCDPLCCANAGLLYCEMQDYVPDPDSEMNLQDSEDDINENLRSGLASAKPSALFQIWSEHRSLE